MADNNWAWVKDNLPTLIILIAIGVAWGSITSDLKTLKDQLTAQASRIERLETNAITLLQQDSARNADIEARLRVLERRPR